LISDDLLQKIVGEIHANRWRAIRELHHIIPKVSKTTIHEAVTEKLGYTKLCANWMPKMLTDDHKTKRMGCVVQSRPHTQWFPCVSSPKETSHWIKNLWHRWGARSHEVVQRASGRLLRLGDTEAGPRT
jgi:hypothetical protein